MSNTLGALNAALIAQEGLALLVAKYPVIGQITTDFSNEPVHLNQDLTTRIPSVGTVQDYDATNGYVPANISNTDVTITLNKFKHATFALSDAELSSTNRNLIAEYSKSFADSIGLGVMADIAALFTAANYSNTTVVTLANSNRKSVIVAANAALNKRNAMSDRFGVLNPDLVNALWSDDSIVYMTAGGTGIEAGQLPVIHNVAISEYSALPTTGNLTGVIGAKDSIVFASRTPSDAGFADLPATGRVSVVTDPKSGLSVQVREFYNGQTGKRQVTFALIYGLGVGNPASLQRVITSVPA